MMRLLALVVLCAVVALGVAPAEAGGSTKGTVSANVASVSASGVGDFLLKKYPSILSVVRASLDIPVKSVATQVAGQVTSVIGTVAFFAADVQLDPDARKGVQALQELHTLNEAVGVNLGPSALQGVKAGIPVEDLKGLYGVE